ncbi:MAG: M10 family metallopeptidase C-terminal domain-containing protein [Neomegalonema sp.]|nr:M10 family metallopeptidase C-terminal domain-containing protein [Neomegalonema sp.]
MPLNDADAALLNICLCPVCAVTCRPDEGDLTAYSDLSATPLFTLDPSNPDSGLIGTSINGLPVWSAEETAAHIARPYGDWTLYTDETVTVTYSFPTDSDINSTDFDDFDASEQAGARRVMDLVSDVANITFVEADESDGGQIQFRNISTSQNGGGWANYPYSGTVLVNIGHVSWGEELVEGEYRFRLLMHELGHGVGLAHPGDYNGSSAQYSDADHYNDSRQYSNMSYWSESYTGASFGYAATYQLHDILALQQTYGANMSTRTDDTVYGFNATAGLVSYDLSHDADMAFAIWDAGGTDTLDFSGYTGSTAMDLRDGAFSSGAGLTYNVAIAYGAVIENAIGADAADEIRGNEYDNILTGRLGNDRIEGAEGDDILIGDGSGIGAPEDFGIVTLNEGAETGRSIRVTGFDAMPSDGWTVEFLQAYGQAPESAYYDIDFPGFSLYQFTDTNLYFKGWGEVDTWHSTGISPEELFDGGLHRISISWDSASGQISFYLDGKLQASTTSNQGASWPSSGTVKFADHSRVGDIRLFSGARSAEEIEANAFNTLADPASETDLVAYWQVDPADPSTVSDVVGGADMTIAGDPALGTMVFESRTDDDTLDGGEGDDLLQGGAGDDILIGGLGSDDMQGGDGSDTVSYASAASAVTVNLTAQTGSGGEAAGDVMSSVENAIGSAYNDRLIGDANANQLEGGEGVDTLSGFAGDDALYGGGGRDRLYGQEGDDLLDGGDEIDLLVGGAGNDTLYGGGDADRLYTNDGDDIVYGGDGADRAWGEAGNDTLFGEGGVDVLNGMDGNDIIDGGEGNDRNYGGAGNDIVSGGDGNDIVHGLTGTDTLNGNAGNDRYYGGADADLFVFDIGSDVDTIYDFEQGIDTIVLNGYGFSSFADFSDDIYRAGSTSVRIQLNADDVILVRNSTIEDWDASDFTLS